MSSIKMFFPFIEEAPIIRRESYTVDPSVIFNTYDLLHNSELYLSNVTEGWQFPITQAYSAYQVLPLGYIVLIASDAEIKFITERRIPVEVVVTVVDYSVIARTLEGDDNTAELPGLVTGSYIKEDIKTREYINRSILGEKVFEFTRHVEKVDSVPVYDPEPIVNEEVSLDIFKNGYVTANGVGEGTSAYMTRLESYFKSSYTTNRVPLLVGGSAVGKSALLKSLTSVNNMRLIDIRTAFMSRLEIEGLTQKIEVNGEILSYNCPMCELVEATDSYIEYCEKAVTIIEDELKKELSPDMVLNLNEALVGFKEGAKIPVLMFDEVTRGEASVRQALTKILSDKEFMGFSMKRARVVAATNAMIDKNGNTMDIFQTAQIDDVAFYDRFESMYIQPMEVKNSWSEWAVMKDSKGVQNINPIILDYLRMNASDVYDMSELERNYEKSGDINDITAATYPNYRTWEMLSKYLDIKKSTYNPTYIKSIIGNITSIKFISHLNMIGWKEEKGVVKGRDYSDDLTEMVNNGMESGVPTLLIGPSGVAKTGRIRQAVQDMGAVFIPVNLGQQDRLDLSGPPAKVDINRYIMGKSHKVTQDVKDKLEKLLGTVDLPRAVTIRSPKESLVKKFKYAYESGRDIVIFYDEMNRVQNPSVMSSVFECISDHKAFGIKFDPERVKIFGACNLGDNVQDAQSLDPALANRFAVYRKMGYDSSDVDAFLKYAEKAKFSEVTLEFLKSMPKEKLISYLASVETRTLESSASSSRGIEDLDKFISDESNNGFMSGTVLFKNASDLQLMNDLLVRGEVLRIENMLTDIDKTISNWSALRDKSLIVTIGKNKLTAKDLVETYKKVRGSVKSAEMDKILLNIVRSLMVMDNKIKSKRQSTLKYFLGDGYEEFNKFYSTVSGRANIRIDVRDLVDKTLIKDYVTNKLSLASNQAVIVPTVVDMLNGIWKVHKDNMPQINYQMIFREIFEFMSNKDVVYTCVQSITSDVNRDSMLKKAEGTDKGFIEYIAKKAGITYDPATINTKVNPVVPRLLK